MMMDCIQICKHILKFAIIYILFIPVPKNFDVTRCHGDDSRLCPTTLNTNITVLLQMCPLSLAY